MVELPQEMEESQRLKWNQWKQEEVTKDFFQMLANRLQDNFHDWRKGLFNGSDLGAFVAGNAKAQGGVQIINEILELDFEDIYLVKGKETDEQERHTSYRGSSPHSPGRN